jgi:hypothetical protein
MGPLLNERFINFTSAVHFLFLYIIFSTSCARYYCIEIKKNFAGNKHKKKEEGETTKFMAFIFFRKFGNDLISSSWGRQILRAFRADFLLT